KSQNLRPNRYPPSPVLRVVPLSGSLVYCFQVLRDQNPMWSVSIPLLRRPRGNRANSRFVAKPDICPTLSTFLITAITRHLVLMNCFPDEDEPRSAFRIRTLGRE